MVSRLEQKTIRNHLLEDRVFLGRAIEEGIEPPCEFERGVLLRGRVHQIFSEAGMGKSWLALWLIKEAVGRRERVLYLDMENGPRIVSERLDFLGVDPEAVDELFVYLPSPTLTMQARAIFPHLAGREVRIDARKTLGFGRFFSDLPGDFGLRAVMGRLPEPENAAR